MHEEHKRGTLAEVAAWYKEHEPKGEIVIIVAGADKHCVVEEKDRGENGKTHKRFEKEDI